MPSISSTGIGSGLDVNSIVTQMMALERRPLNLLQQAKSGLDTKLSAVGALQSRMSGLLDASKALTSDTLWNRIVATSSDAAALTASASSDAVQGRYGVRVDNLASKQTVVSDAFSDPLTGLQDATLEISLGRWGDTVDPSGFTPKTGSTALSIDLAAIRSGDFAGLYEIRDAINGANAGMNATVINDASGYRLALSSTETGTDNAFRVRVLDSTGGLFEGSKLNYDAFQPTSSGMTRTQTAGNAQVTINGIPIQSTSNTFGSSVLSGVADGLTFNASRVTTEEVEVNVGLDRAGIQKGIENFVSAFNDLAGYIGEKTAYNAESKVGGTLQGDPMINSLRNQMRGILNHEFRNVDTSYSSLSDIGISFTSTGTLSINSTKLSDAVGGNLDELKLLLAKDGARDSRRGYMPKFVEFATSALGTDGLFESRTNSLKGQITQNERRQDSMDRRFTQTEERLRRQYQTLDTSMSNLGGTSDYLAQQLSLLSGLSNRR